MNPLAKALNEQIQAHGPEVFEMLSSLGTQLFFPKGILAQSAEARQKAFRVNATIGIALEQGESMHLDCIHKWMPDLPADDIFPYAPAAGKPALRDKWAEKQLSENPSMAGKTFGKPIVTHALTHGLTLLGDLFLDPGDPIILPDKFWGNYRLMLEVRRGARIVTYPFLDDRGRFNVKALRKTIREQADKAKKVVVILNFPNNPCGYSIHTDEADELREALLAEARQGTRILAVLDEAYFGLFYTEGLLKESLFGQLINQEKNLLVAKLDGATKEEFVWGFRIGFLTFGLGPCDAAEPVLEALEKKVMGDIRGSISNCSNLSQTLVLKALESPEFAAQRAEKFAILKGRADYVRKTLDNPKFADAWQVYPFNSGYFMCLRVNGVDGEDLRRHLLDTHGVGIIAAGGEDVRVAFSCIEEEQIPELFDLIHQSVLALKG